MRYIHKFCIYAYYIIAFPLLVIALMYIWFPYVKKYQNVPPLEMVHETINNVLPHCFFIDLLLCGFYCVFFVN